MDEVQKPTNDVCIIPYSFGIKNCACLLGNCVIMESLIVPYNTRSLKMMALLSRHNNFYWGRYKDGIFSNVSVYYIPPNTHKCLSIFVFGC
jgi:hypothetical protein